MLLVRSWILACACLILCQLPGVGVAAPDDEWKELAARKTQLIEKLKGLQQAFQVAETREAKEKIATEFEQIRDQFLNDVQPKIVALAPQVFAADAKNFEAGEVLLESAFQENRYDAAAKVAQQLLAAGDQSMIVQNMGGISLFATHQFEAAHELLSAAEKAGQLHPQLGGRYLDSSLEYAEYWKKEQAIRAREAQLEGPDQLPRVVFNTTKGPITIELFENEAPNTVANFISLIESKTYDGVKFHRVIPTFMAQGGDPLSKDEDPRNDGTGGPGYAIACECYRPDARLHFRGSLSMAHAGKDTGGSQFFITHLPTSHLNPSAAERRGHTVFGRIVEGMDTAMALEIGDTIETATVLRKRNHPYKPQTLPDPRR